MSACKYVYVTKCVHVHECVCVCETMRGVCVFMCLSVYVCVRL